MKNLTEMLKKAQEMQSKMGDMQSGLADMTVEGEAGAGMVKVTLDGTGQMKNVSIDDSLFSTEDREVLEDLIVAAHNQAKAKVADAAAAQMKDLAGGMGLPDGFKMPF